MQDPRPQLALVSADHALARWWDAKGRHETEHTQDELLALAFAAGWDARIDYVADRRHLMVESGSGCGAAVLMIAALFGGGALVTAGMLWAQGIAPAWGRVAALVVVCILLVPVGLKLLRRDRASYAQQRADFEREWGPC